MYSKKTYRYLLVSILSFCGFFAQGQTAYFADGYHGGVYGHYPIWQAKFMVDKLNANPDWKINLELEPETWDSVKVNDYANYRLLQDYYSKIGRVGRIEFVNPAYAQPYCYNISGESIIRQFRYGMTKIREHFPEATFLTYSCEEPCFTSSLPEILNGFGFHYAVLRNPNTCWGGYTSGFGKDLVNWIGPDGTSIPAVPRYACEKLSTNSTWQTDSWSNSNEFVATCFANGIKYPVGMTFQDAGWQGGPWGNQYEPTMYVTWTGYIDMIKDKVKPVDWNFTQEDVKPGLVWGAQVLQRIAQSVRVSESKMITAEKMASLDFLLNGRVWPAADFAEGWRTLMLSQHHDCWIVPYNGRPGNTWADKVVRWTNSSDEIADQKINQLFSQEKDGSDRFIRVFNTLGFQRNDAVAVAVPDGLLADDFSVCNLVGEIVPSQVVKNENGQSMLYFEAKVPGMGFADYRLEIKAQPIVSIKVEKLADGSLMVETNFYKAVIDSKKGGTITSLVAKKQHNIELVEKGKCLNNLLGYFYKEGKFNSGSESNAKVTVVENGELFVRLLVENQLAGNAYKQLITFAKDNPRIDFELEIDWEGQPGIGEYNQSQNYKAEERQKAFYNDAYKLHVEFPFDSLGSRLFKNAPFDVCESQLPNTVYSSWDSIKHNVILNWVDVANASNDRGVALFSDHTTSYLQTNDLPLGLTVQYIGKGLWGRNYQVEGPTRISYALLPHTDNWDKACLEAESNSWGQPLIGKLTNLADQQTSWSLLDVADKCLEVSSVIVRGDDLYVRFFNTSATNDKQKVSWNCSADQIEKVDLSGKVLSTILPVRGEKGMLNTSLTIPKFGIQTIKLTRVKANLK